MFSSFIMYPAEATTYLQPGTQKYELVVQQHKAVSNHFVNFTHPYNVIPDTLWKAKSKAYDQKVERIPDLNVLLHNYFD